MAGHPGAPGMPGQPPYGAPPQYGAPGYGQPPPYGQPPTSRPAGAGFDLKRLKMADYVIVGGMVLYLVLALFPWWDYGSIYGFSVSTRGFSSGLVTFAFVLFLLAAAWVVLPAFTDLRLGFPRSWITVGLAVLGFLFTLFAWIDTLSVAFSIWALLGLLVSLVIALFAGLSLLPELRNRPALPGALAGAAQWANQPSPQFGQGGSQQPGQFGSPPPAPPTTPYGMPGHAQQPAHQPPAQQPTHPPTEPYIPGAGAAGPAGATPTPPPPPPAAPAPPAGGESTGTTGGSTGATASGSGESTNGSEQPPGVV